MILCYRLWDIGRNSYHTDRVDATTPIRQYQLVATQMDKSIEMAALLWSKMAFFNWVWQKVKVLSRPWTFLIHIELD